MVGFALIPNCHIPAQAPTTSQARLHRSMILSALNPDHDLTVTHHGIALTRYSFNFGVPMEPEASELLKSLVLGRDENIHIRLRGSTPLDDMRCYNSPLRYYNLCHIPARVHHIPDLFHHRSMILSALGPDYALMVLFLGTHTRTSQWVTHHGIALARYSLNFGVSMELEASELPKGLVLGRDENIHIMITPLGDVGSYNLPP
ncbi:unnamed protein product [Malus baccata var. baccata]